MKYQIILKRGSFESNAYCKVCKFYTPFTCNCIFSAVQYTALLSRSFIEMYFQKCQTLPHWNRTTRFFKGCEMQIERSAMRVNVRHHEACRTVIPSDRISSLHRTTNMDSRPPTIAFQHISVDYSSRCSSKHVYRFSALPHILHLLDEHGSIYVVIIRI